MEKVVTDYLKLLNIPVSESYCKKRIASHPDYPSLLSVADTLEQLGIPYVAARLEKDQLGTLTFPYLLHVEKGGGEFVIVREQKDLNKQPDLLGDWSGNVLLAEAPESIEDEGNRKHLSKERASRFAFGVFLLSVLAMVVAGWIHSFSWANILLSTTAIAGAVLGYLLVAKDLGVKYDTVESFCNAGKKTNCDQVLHSGEATLFGQFSFSDTVLSYFVAQFITAGLLIPVAGMASPMWWALAAIGVLSLPIVAYSIWLQAFKLKTWCKLCLLVAGVLLLQAGMIGWMVAGGVFGLADGGFVTTAIVWALFAATGALVYLIKSRLKEGAEAKQEQAAANRIKFNPSVFTHLLFRQPKADCTPFEEELLIGNPDSPVNITMAASLRCGPCKEGFEQATRLVRMCPEKVNLSVRFSLSQQSDAVETDPGRYLLGYWLTALNGTDDQSFQAEKMLKDWFELSDLNRFREKYSFQTNGKNQNIDAVASHISNWFKKTEVKGTPTFFVNGYKLPTQYLVEDLRYVVTGFSEMFTTENDNMKGVVRAHEI